MILSTSPVAVSSSTLAQLTEQPRVLHRDHRLRGEAFQERDLFLGEGPDLSSRGSDLAKKRAVLAQGDIEHGPNAAELDSGTLHGIVDLG